MHFVEGLVSPLSAILKVLFEWLHRATGSLGLSIVLLSILVSLLLTPVAAFARRLEAREQARQQAMAPLILEAKAGRSGREQFEKIDEIYQQFHYHPIQSMGSLLPLLVQIPFLLAALFFLVDYAPLSGRSFLFIRDLSLPDGLLKFGASVQINLLPIALTAIAIAESQMRKGALKSAQLRFLFVSAVLLVLVYPFPAAVCLYWLTSNAFSFVRSSLRPAPAAAPLGG